ncbi:hypothetical protein L1887_58789 [Cichorium endivia]|nr:hypothetical protein L1887_58789 [Cichorium endivia]
MVLVSSVFIIFSATVWVECRSELRKSPRKRQKRNRSGKTHRPSLCDLNTKNEYDADNYFIGLIDMVKQLLDGNLDSNQFEDQLREMFGIHAYVSFTLDKVVQNIVRQLQHIVCEESSVQATELFLEASKANAGGGPCSTAHLRAGHGVQYQKKAESLLTEENIFKVLLFKDEGKLTIELLDSESTDSEDESAPTVKWMDYINKYAKENSELSESMKQKPDAKAALPAAQHQGVQGVEHARPEHSE